MTHIDAAVEQQPRDICRLKACKLFKTPLRSMYNLRVKGFTCKRGVRTTASDAGRPQCCIFLSTVTLVSFLSHKRNTLGKIGACSCQFPRSPVFEYLLFCKSLPVGMFSSQVYLHKFDCLPTPSSITDDPNLLFHFILIAD